MELMLSLLLPQTLQLGPTTRKPLPASLQTFFGDGHGTLGGVKSEVWTRFKQGVPRSLAICALSTSLMSRRKVLIIGAALPCCEAAAYADESVKEKEDNDGSVLGGILSLLDPDEKTKSGKVLPKGYIKSAKEVVKTLKESLKEDSADINKFYKSADSAKEAIRSYLRDWRDDKLVASEDSYTALERAFRVLGEFYSKKGPRAILPDEVKSQILENLDVADASL